MTIHGVEYDVFFGGTHYGADQDLLCCEPVLVKRDAPPIEPSKRMVTIQRQGKTSGVVLACCEDGPVTKPDIIAETGFSPYAVDMALRGLQERGKVRVVGKLTRGTGRGRWLKQYQA